MTGVQTCALPIWIQSSEVMTVDPNQIIEVRSDPSEIEFGWIDFDFQGGRK